MRNDTEHLLKSAILALSTAALTTLAVATPTPVASTARSGEEAAIYSLGLTFGGQLHHSGLKEGMSTDALMQGIRDGLKGKTATSEDKLRVSKLLQSAKEAAGAKNNVAAREFLAENAKSEGVTTLASGLQYKVLCSIAADC